MKIFKKPIFYMTAILFFLIVSCTTREVVQPTQEKKQERVAVVLGAGAARGFSHVGVLKVLEQHKTPIDILVGTSAGSFVATLYASGYTAFQLQRIALDLQKDDVVDFILPDNGFIRGEKLQSFVNKKVNNVPLEKMRIPLRVVATDIRAGNETVFATGNAGWAVRASCSVPGVFQPVQIGQNVYVDGGVVSPVAVYAARKAGADVVIAVDISSGVVGTAPQGTVNTILQSIDIMYSRISEEQLKTADVVIRPKVQTIGAPDFEKRYDAILEGEKAAVLALPQIAKVLDRLRQEGRLPALPTVVGNGKTF
jgi:NTE family protein